MLYQFFLHHLVVYKLGVLKHFALWEHILTQRTKSVSSMQIGGIESFFLWDVFSLEVLNILRIKISQL